eukprot:jgi/Mesvir1/20705/Mv14903-RA.2
MSMVPSYISRSVAGSYDNEGVAIFALVFTFFLYVKTLKTGSLFWGLLNALAFFYMVCSWGGYTFIINLIPIHALVLLLMGRFSSRLYIAYAPLIVLGTLLAASVPVVGFNAVMTSEHFASFLVFAALHLVSFVTYLKNTLPPKVFRKATMMVVTAGSVAGVAFISSIVVYVAASPTMGWTGRSLSLLDPTYAGKHIPIIASVSEHQPPSWTSYFMDLHILIFFMPVGLVTCFTDLTDASVFLALYLVTSAYFSGVMVRLMLVLSPAAALTAGVGFSTVVNGLCSSIVAPSNPTDAAAASAIDAAASAGGAEASTSPEGDAAAEGSLSSRRQSSQSKGGDGAAKPDGRKAKGSSKKGSSSGGFRPTLWNLPKDVSLFGLLLLLAACVFYVMHCVWVSSMAYSAPSVVLTSRSNDGSLHVFDDFREAYAWLEYNTHPEDIVTSWWDYGYQTTAMANRTVLVDNNTWNNTHIATVGRAMSSTERKGWQIFSSLDVKFVFVVFGGLVGYPSDDINKFLWMVRIGGGVFPDIKEENYLAHGSYRIDAGATQTMLNSVMYKLSYYRFAEATQGHGQSGYDRVRGTEIGRKNFKLKYFEEAFTSSHWMVRIYKVLDKPARDSASSRKELPGGKKGGTVKQARKIRSARKRAALWKRKKLALAKGAQRAKSKKNTQGGVRKGGRP